MNNKYLSRRNLLRASGVAISLPFLDMFHQKTEAAQNKQPKRRMVAINVGLGLHAANIIPTTAGRNYELTTYLKQIGEFREQFTIVSGTSHPEVGGGHASHKSFLTAAKHPNSAGFKNTISIDQLAAEKLGAETRFASLALTTSGPGISCSRDGVEIPAIRRPSFVFKQLFLEGNPKEKAEQVQRLKDGRSVLDLVMDKTKSMNRRLGKRDQQKLAQYLNAVRETESRLTKAEAWEHRPKPEVDAKLPRDQTDRTRIIECLDLLYDVMHLAIETDSTRFITLFDTGMNAVPVIKGVDTDYHMLSHHGKEPTKISQLTIIESEMMKSLNRFLMKLNESQEAGHSLLDNTMVLFGSNLGNASSHDTRNMPMLLAGGGFKHGQHLAFDQKKNTALPKLYVSMLQRLGIETNTFAATTGTLPGLEMT